MKSRLLISSSLLAAFSLANAASINWGLATNVVDANDVSTTGTVAEAFNLTFNGDFDTTVNGVFFENLTNPAPLSNGAAGAANALNGNTTGDSAYDTLLNTNAFGGGTSTTFTLSGLTIAQGYEIQLWYVEQRAAQSGRSMIYGDGLGSTITLAGDAGDFGQFGTGTFTADAATQTISLATNGFGNSHLTAYQVRAIPESSAYALLSGITVLSLVATRRRR